jgi:crotonobetainyl-CoA:carnitine CoA-transferase CaiB-like acyl-CoA transferase
VAISSSSDSVARRVLALIGHGDDARFAGFQARSKNREALEAYVAAWVGARPSEEVLREFRRVDAAIAKVLDMKDIFADEHFRARGMIAEVDGVVMQDVVAGMSKTPGRLRHQGRPFDADTKAVLARFATSAKKPRQKT